MNFFSFLLDAANWGGPDGLGIHLGEHLLYSVIAVAIAAVIGIPVGQLIGHTRRGSFLVVGLANSFRAIPTFGLLILVVLLTETSWIPVVCVLGVLALPPLLTGTATGIMQADQQAVHAARALGMSGGQVLSRVEMPLAMPLIISGLRSATLQVIATATVAAYVPQVGGLGRTILDGIPARDYGQVLAGALLVALLAIVIDVLLALIGRATSRHLRLKAPRATALTAAPTTTSASAPSVPGDQSADTAL